MSPSAYQVTHRRIAGVLLAGFGLVILLLLAAGFVAVRNIHAIQRNAETLVEEYEATSALIDEIEHERVALNAVLYDVARGPKRVDPGKVLADLDSVNRRLDEIVNFAEGTPEVETATELRRAAEQFFSEIRRVLHMKDTPARLSHELFRRHQQVVSIAAKLIADSQMKSQAAQRMIDQQSKELMTQSFVLLGAGLLLALLCAVFTVRLTAGLFRRMEWQASELSRVSWRLVEAQEEAARRFSHELHDELGQALTAIKANLISLSGTDGSDRRLEDCVQLIDGAIQNVRELSHLLRPTVLDDFGLDASIRWLAERFSQRTNIEATYTSNFHGRLRDDVETHLFRIAQEALTNVARHSGASRVALELHADGDEIRLRIADNGRGLPANGEREQAGMGLSGMRARARSAGGELRQHSSPGKGLSIEVTVPFNASRDDQKTANFAG